MPTGLGKEKISGQHRHLVVEAAVHGGHTAAGGGLIHHIVVHQGGGVDHLSDLRQPPVPGRELALRADRPRDQEHDAGAQLLAAGTEQMLGGRLQDRMAGADQGAQISQEGIKVGFDRLKQFCDRCHETQPVRRS